MKAIERKESRLARPFRHDAVVLERGKELMELTPHPLLGIAVAEFADRGLETAQRPRGCGDD